MKGLQEFKERLYSEDEFYQSYVGVTEVDTLIAKARTDGYEFTKEDLANDTKIMDEELKNIAGGVGFNNNLDRTGVSNGIAIPHSLRIIG